MDKEKAFVDKGFYGQRKLKYEEGTLPLYTYVQISDSTIRFRL